MGDNNNLEQNRRDNSVPTTCTAHNTATQLSQLSASQTADTSPRYRFEGEERIHYLESLVSKQFELYSWCETKMNTLAIIDSIILTGAIIFVDRMKVGVFPQRTIDSWLRTMQVFMESHFSYVLVLLILVPVFMSLGLSLWHIIPKMRSNATPKTISNHRSSVGINRYGDIPSYKKRIDDLNEQDIYEDLVRQIFGMNKNVWRNQKSIRLAVWLDLIGLAGFFLSFVYLVICGIGFSLF